MIYLTILPYEAAWETKRMLEVLRGEIAFITEEALMKTASVRKLM